MQTREDLLRYADLIGERIDPIGSSESETEALDAVVHELRALRLTIAAAIAATADTTATAGEKWARVELFGHTVTYGQVLEVEVAGRRFLEVVEPAHDNPDDPQDPFLEQRKRYHPNAVYALQELGEAEVMDTIRRRHGLHKWADGTWHTTYEGVSTVDLVALADREMDDLEHDEDDIPI